MATRLTLLYAISAPILFGSVPTCVRFLSANAFTIGVFRATSAAIVLTILLTYRTSWPKVTRSELKWLMLTGLTFGLHWLTYFLSIKLSSASLAALAFSTYGIQLTIVGCLFGLHSIHRADILALGLATIGSYLILPEVSFESSKTWGVFIGIVSAFLYSLLPVLHQKRPEIDPTLRTWGQITFAMPIFLIFLPQTEWSLSGFEWIVMLYVGVVVTVLGHSLWVRATCELSTAICSLINYLYLPSSLFLAWLFLDESIQPEMIAGAALIFVGTSLSLLSRVRSKALLAGQK